MAERFIRTLKEPLLCVWQFNNSEELRRALQQWRQQYNSQWRIGRHGYRTPLQVRKAFIDTRAVA